MISQLVGRPKEEKRSRGGAERIEPLNCGIVLVVLVARRGATQRWTNANANERDLPPTQPVARLLELHMKSYKNLWTIYLRRGARFA